MVLGERKRKGEKSNRKKRRRARRRGRSCKWVKKEVTGDRRLTVGGSRPRGKVELPRGSTK